MKNTFYCFSYFRLSAAIVFWNKLTGHSKNHNEPHETLSV